MVFQNYALWPHMTVWQNVAFGLEERKLPRAEIERRTADALDLVGLRELGARRPSQISGGQQQRIALARTIAIEPKVLLLDEPLSNLDAKLRVHMRTELLALQRKLGITTIFVTHDQEEALSIADRVAVLDQGVIQQVARRSSSDTPANRFIAVRAPSTCCRNARAGRRAMVFRSNILGAIRFAAAAAPPGPAEIAIRPHAIHLAAHDVLGDAGLVWAEGSVTQREFLGEFVRYTVKIGQTELTADQPHHTADPGFAPGATVRVGFNPAQVRLLSA
jgi:iron(III) transport system ATP-binding protein